MPSDKTDIWVYAHWRGITIPKCIGILSAHRGKGRKSFSFAYHPDWLASERPLMLDPDIGWYAGAQFPNQKENFGMFSDAMPDTWGRTLMKRRNAQKARQEGKSARALYDVDFLLGVYDEARMGGLRFRLDPDGPFMDHQDEASIPPWASVRELQHGANQLETSSDQSDQWLAVLMAPGSSLGGARPKANVLDDQGHPWIAKFPTTNDTIDRAQWEYLAYRLATQAGINMAESKIEKIAGSHHTFFTKRFDRTLDGGHLERIHFASAMTMTGNNEGKIRDHPASYLDIAEFIQFTGDRTTEDLHQLWRRIVFSVAISNTDDHLRNHGFILTPQGWRLSPAYDINPSIDKDGLSLNIDAENNALDFEVIRRMSEYFQLTQADANRIMDEVRAVVSTWSAIATDLGIPRAEQLLMAGAFRY